MAKVTGTYVGTPKLQPGYQGISNIYENGEDNVLNRDLATTNGNAIGDTVSLGIYPSGAFFSPLSTVWNGAFGAGCTLSVGDINYPHGIANAQSIAAAGSFMPFEALADAMWWQPLWAQLGYPANPGGVIELLGTFAGAAPANANLKWELRGQLRIGG